MADTKKVARDCLIGMGAVVNKDTEEGKVYRGSPAKPSSVDSFTIFGVKSEGAA